LIESNNKCQCQSYKGIHNIIYQPGNCEAIVQCQDCGQLWYSLLFEQMNFAGADTLDEYQIPISTLEYQQIIDTAYQHLNLKFLANRPARVIHEGGIVQIDSNLALSRCGRSGS
jgi:hypothetical protein